MDRLTQLKTMPYEEYLKTPEWKAMRLKILARDGNRCRNCNSGKNLNVHHRTYARRGHEDPNDLTTLCEGCHEIFHQSVKQEEIIQRTQHIPFTKEEMEQRNKENIKKWEDYLIGLLIQHRQLLSHVRVIVSEEDFEGEDTKALYCILITLQENNKELNDYPIPDQLLPLIDRIKSFKFFGGIHDEKTLIKDAIECAIFLKRAHLLQLNREIRDLLDAAYRSGDTNTMRTLMEQSTTINHGLRTIDEVSRR